MEGVDHRGKKWKSFKQRLGLKKMSCCGASWSFRATSNMVEREEEQEQELTTTNAGQNQVGNLMDFDPDPDCVGHIPTTGMNLATALAAEREFRAAQEWEGGSVGPTSASPKRVSLIRLLEETDGDDEEKEKGVGNESICCVCMGRKKGAAFIPCGHTFCRVCSREIWLNRGSCPLCNRSVLEILDIF